MKIAIVGATGEVGRMMLTCLSELNLEIEQLDLYASARSAGKILYYNDKPCQVQLLDTQSLTRHYDYVLFSAGAGIALSFAEIACAANSVVIDNSSAFRREENIPLVVPEINGEVLQGYYGIVANPNCSTIQVVLPLAIMDRLFSLTKVIVSTYQSVSGSGHTGVSLLMAQRSGSEERGSYPHLIDLNVIPQIGGFLDDGYCQEEDKMRFETKKILTSPNLMISATTVRVPVLYGHCVSAYAEFEHEVDLGLLEETLCKSESIDFFDNTYVTPREIGNSDNSIVCRLRYGTDKKSVTFWNLGHNVRLGAATNAVRILKKHYVSNQ